MIETPDEIKRRASETLEKPHDVLEFSPLHEALDTQTRGLRC